MSAKIPDVGSEWRHKNGNEYFVICIANSETEKPDEYPVTVVYKGIVSGPIWARPLSRWYGSMTEITE